MYLAHQYQAVGYQVLLPGLSVCSLQVVDGSPIEVTLAKPVDKDSYVRYTRGTGGRGGSVLQTDYTTYTLSQVGDKGPDGHKTPEGSGITGNVM